MINAKTDYIHVSLRNIVPFKRFLSPLSVNKGAELISRFDQLQVSLSCTLLIEVHIEDIVTGVFVD